MTTFRTNFSPQFLPLILNLFGFGEELFFSGYYILEFRGLITNIINTIVQSIWIIDMWFSLFSWVTVVNPSKQTFTCSKSIIEALEKGVKYV